MTDSTIHIGSSIAEMRIGLLGLAVLIAASAVSRAQSTQLKESQTPRIMDREKEVALALSACPLSVADKAPVFTFLTNLGTSKFGIARTASRRSCSTHCRSARTHNAWMQKARARFFRAT